MTQMHKIAWQRGGDWSRDSATTSPCLECMVVRDIKSFLLEKPPFFWWRVRHVAMSCSRDFVNNLQQIQACSILSPSSSQKRFFMFYIVIFCLCLCRLGLLHECFLGSTSQSLRWAHFDCHLSHCVSLSVHEAHCCVYFYGQRTTAVSAYCVERTLNLDPIEGDMSEGSVRYLCSTIKSGTVDKKLHNRQKFLCN